jgi:hypothetical protein
MREVLGFIYSLAVLAAILCGVGAVLGMMMNGAGGDDKTGVLLSATLVFAGIAWAILYFIGG